MLRIEKGLSLAVGLAACLFFLFLVGLTFTFQLHPLPADVELLRVGAGIWAALFLIACVLPRKARADLLLLLAIVFACLWGMNRGYAWAAQWVNANSLAAGVPAPPPPPPVVDQPQYEAVMQQRAAGYNAYPYVYHSDTYYDASFYSDASVAVCDRNEKTYDAKKCAKVVPFPLGGISNARMVLCIPRGYENYIKGWAMYDTDRYGFRNPDSVYALDKPALVIGDSFVQGVCVNKGDDVTSRVRSRGWPVIGMGEGGNGPLIEYARLKEYGPTVKPGLVLWLFTEGNDLDDVMRESKSKILQAYYTRDGFSLDLIHRQDAVDAYLKRLEANASETRYLYEKAARAWRSHHGWAVRLAAFPRLAEPLQLWLARWQIDLAAEASSLFSFGKTETVPPPSRAAVDITPAELKSTVDKLGDILTKARSLTESWGGRFVFVFLQDYTTTAKFQPEDGTPWPTRRRWLIKDSHDAVLAKVRSLGIPVLDFGEVISADKDPLRFYEGRGWGHYTLFGYDRLAEFIADHVSR